MIDLSFSYLTKTENIYILRTKFFYNNYGIRAVIIYFYFVLIDLINDYKNIYSHNNNNV